jgi:hypothetical protein
MSYHDDPRDRPSLAEQNARFYNAMLNARRLRASEAKHIVIGVVTKPGTHNPRFVPSKPVIESFGRSVAAQATDSAAEDYRNQRFVNRR